MLRNAIWNVKISIQYLGKRNGHIDLPEYLQEPKAPEVDRNKSIIPENWELTRTPSGSDDSDFVDEPLPSERSKTGKHLFPNRWHDISEVTVDFYLYLRGNEYLIFILGRKSQKVRNKTSAVAAFDNAKRLEKAGGPKVSKRNNDVELLSMMILNLIVLIITNHKYLTIHYTAMNTSFHFST